MLNKDRLFRSVLTIILVVPSIVLGQNVGLKNPLDNKLISAAREIMDSAGTCALITLDQEGRPRVRTMDPFPPDSTMTVWFGTTIKSRKVDQIKNDPRVTLYYLESDNSGYVMIAGIAELVDPKKEKEERWKVEWETFYPKKSEEYFLIKVSPEWIEVISESRNILGDSITWKPPVVFFNK
ncbi:MAG: pyridoxamine 5'-phosphate oxidase family protein [Cyclobacteriaceae bacterium]